MSSPPQGPTVEGPPPSGTDETSMFPVPTEKVGSKFTVALLVAQLVFYIALLGPAIVGVAVKVDLITDELTRGRVLGYALGFGAVAATVGNIVFGQLSDRTASRWGRRRPWIVAGTVGMTLAFVIIALAPNGLIVGIGWFLAQLAANAALAPFVAVLADQVPKFQRAQIAALLGIFLNVGILGGTIVAEQFQDNMLMLFVGPSVLAIIAMTVFAFILPDQVIPHKLPRLSLVETAKAFWISPREHPDFFYAWLSRFLITMATFMFTTFRLFFIEDRAGVTDNPVGAVTVGVFVYTVALIVSAYFAGRWSDKTGRRKLPVAVSTALYAVGTIALTQVSDVSHFYMIEAVLGFAFGIYIGVDLALVTDVLPNPDNAAKDLGVFNIANAIPQSIAPALGAFLLTIGSATNQNYDLLLITAGVLGLIGAVAIIPIKGVR